MKMLYIDVIMDVKEENEDILKKEIEKEIKNVLLSYFNKCEKISYLGVNKEENLY